MIRPIHLFVKLEMINLKTKQPTATDVEDALLHYCLYHLKPEDLEQVPELKRFIRKNGYTHGTKK